MKNVESIVIVGSSGTGKSTLVDGLRHPEYEDKVVMPNRYTTRPERMNDNMSENSHISQAGFKEGVKRGVIVPYWMRPMEGDRQERYGFNQIAEDDDRLRVYSANNAFLRHPNDSTRKVLETGLVVVVAASLLERTRRLTQRSPDMDDAERAARLSDDGTDMLNAHSRVEVIHTTSMSAQRGQLALQALIGRVLNP